MNAVNFAGPSPSPAPAPRPEPEPYPEVVVEWRVGGDTQMRHPIHLCPTRVSMTLTQRRWLGIIDIALASNTGTAQPHPTRSTPPSCVRPLLPVPRPLTLLEAVEYEEMAVGTTRWAMEVASTIVTAMAMRWLSY